MPKTHATLLAAPVRRTYANAKTLHVNVVTVEKTRKQFVRENLKNILSERSTAPYQLLLTTPIRFSYTFMVICQYI